MPTWLRRKSDGVIYGWVEGLSKRTDEFEVVDEVIAFPEKFVPPSAADKDTGLSEKLATVTPDTQPKTAPELSKDATKGLRARGL